LIVKSLRGKSRVLMFVEIIELLSFKNMSKFYKLSFLVYVITFHFGHLIAT
jgi:hypothetical protein